MIMSSKVLKFESSKVRELESSRALEPGQQAAADRREREEQRPRRGGRRGARRRVAAGCRGGGCDRPRGYLLPARKGAPERGECQRPAGSEQRARHPRPHP